MNCGPLFWAASLHDTQCLPDLYQSEHEGSDSQTHPLTRTKPKRGTRVRLWGSETGNVFRQLSEWFWSGWWAQNPAAGFFSVFPLKCPRDSSGAAVLTVFILKHRIALKNTVIYPEFTSNMNRTGEALDVWLDVWVWSQVRFCLLIASWTGSEHICDIQEQKRFLSLVYTDELCWATVCGDVLFINEQQIQTWRLVVSFSPINTSIIRDNEPDEDFRLQTRQIKVDWGVWVRNTWRHIRTILFKLKLQIFSVN